MLANSPRQLPTVSVVMPTYNRRNLLATVLTPLLAESAAHEIVVVVDGSTDGTAELLDEMAHADARLRPVVIENRGMGEARMAGARAATGDVLLLIDDDVKLAPGTVAGHARHHRDGRRLVVVGPMPVGGGPQRSGADFARAIYASEYRRHTRRWQEDPGSILRTLWEGHLSLRRDDLLAIRPPAEPVSAYGYHADIEFGLRCLKSGLSAVFDPDLKAEHLYTRDPAAYLRSAFQSGLGTAALHRSHPDELGPLRDDFAMAGLYAPERALIHASRRGNAADQALTRLVTLLGSLRLYRAQRRAAALLWCIGRDRAVRQTLRPQLD